MSNTSQQSRRQRSKSTIRGQRRRAARRHLSYESLEIRLAMDATGLAGNPFSPDFDLAAIGTQSIRAGDTLVLNLPASGALVSDLDENENPSGDIIRFQLDPDDTPAGATITTDGVITWTPGLDQVGRFELIVFAIDSGMPPLADAEVVIVEVAENIAPDLAVISDQTVAVNEQLAMTITATDSNGGNLTFILDRDDPGSTLPEDAALEQLSNNTAVIRWTPDAADVGGSFNFSVIVTDDGFPPRSDLEHFTVRVMSVAAVNDMYEVAANGILTVDAGTGVLANDSVSNGDAISATIVSTPGNGSVTLSTDGSFTYTPTSLFQGTDTFTYQALNAGGDHSRATVTIHVNSAPAVVNDSYSTDEDTPLTIDSASGVLNNDSEADSDPLTVSLVDAATNGTVTLNTDGSFAYLPNPDFNGTDSFTYQATDGFVTSVTATATITVAAMNDAPLATSDSYMTAEDATLTIAAESGVLANDSDVDGDSLTATIVSDVSNGAVSLNTDGSFTYTPDADFAGTDTFTYMASDSSATEGITTVTINVVEQNTFTVDEHSAEGTAVGRVTLEGDLGSTVIYTIDDPTLDSALELVADDHITGNPAGSVVLIEYVDFQCPVCLTYHPIVEQLEQDFAGELIVVTRHLPLESVHPNASAAAIAAEAAGRQGAFDAFGDLLFDNQEEWDDAADPTSFFDIYATQLGLDINQFRTDVADTALAERVDRDASAATGLGVTGTPTFFLDGQQIANPASLAEFQTLIQAQVDSIDAVFALDRQTGEITVLDSAALDFETTPIFSLTINAVGLSASETITATIRLTDVGETEAEGEASASLLDDIFAGEDDWLMPL